MTEEQRLVSSSEIGFHPEPLLLLLPRLLVGDQAHRGFVVGIRSVRIVNRLVIRRIHFRRVKHGIRFVEKTFDLRFPTLGPTYSALSPIEDFVLVRTRVGRRSVQAFPAAGSGPAFIPTLVAGSAFIPTLVSGATLISGATYVTIPI